MSVQRWTTMMIAVAVAALCGCVADRAEKREEGETASRSTSSAWSRARDDCPVPVDPQRLVNPIPINPFDQPEGPTDFDVFNEEEWERNPMGRGCYITYVAIYDPTKSKRIEVPVTVCQ